MSEIGPCQNRWLPSPTLPSRRHRAQRRIRSRCARLLKYLASFRPYSDEPDFGLRQDVSHRSQEIPGPRKRLPLGQIRVVREFLGIRRTPAGKILNSRPRWASVLRFSPCLLRLGMLVSCVESSNGFRTVIVVKLAVGIAFLDPVKYHSE